MSADERQLTTLEVTLLRQLAREQGMPLGYVALHYGVRFDEATGRLYCRTNN